MLIGGTPGVDNNAPAGVGVKLGTGIGMIGVGVGMEGADDEEEEEGIEGPGRGFEGSTRAGSWPDMTAVAVIAILPV